MNTPHLTLSKAHAMRQAREAQHTATGLAAAASLPRVDGGTIDAHAGLQQQRDDAAKFGKSNQAFQGHAMVTKNLIHRAQSQMTAIAIARVHAANIDSGVVVPNHPAPGHHVRDGVHTPIHMPR